MDPGTHPVPRSGRWAVAAATVAAALAWTWVCPAGAQEATYLMRGDQLPVSTVANGYVQSVTPSAPGEVLVRVAVTLGPVLSAGPPPAGDPTRAVVAPDHFVVPPPLVEALRGERSAYAAATRILGWVMANVALDVDDPEPQDATSVLERRRGRCSGLANVTAALLLVSGFEARTVSGLLMAEDHGTAHRWVECRLPGAGWVPTDPTLGPWTITPRHVAFADAVSSPPSVTVLTAQPADLGDLPRLDGRPHRPNLGSELRCRVVDGPVDARTVAVLSGPFGEERRSVLAPEGRFSGLLPGRWRLVVERDGKVIERRELTLAGGTVHSFAVRAAAVEGR
jgi:hypothetical protein